jgi:Icc-related predicted phosphoesterase
MALTRIIGDIHGKIYDYRSYALVTGIRGRQIVQPERSIQVGDFGIGFFSSFWHEKEIEWQKEHPQHRFIRGNHDDPVKCFEMPGWISDGMTEDGVMYVGGAWSIDHAWRTPGKDWWPDEELSYEQLENMIDIYRDYKPRVMITHDCPTSVAWEMFLSKGLGLGDNRQIKTRTGEALQAMFEMHQPELWVFGHWHNTRKQEINGTTFQCLGELDHIDVEL